jgi:hypothetical protein
MARTPSAREHYDLEVSKLTVVIRVVEQDTRRGEEWKAETLSALRKARELLARQAPPSDPTPSKDAGTRRRPASKAT